MQDKQLLSELLEAESEDAVLTALNTRGLLAGKANWRYLGNLMNNQSVVHAQQSTPAAALVEKFTNGVDAILIRHCKEAGVDPRSSKAPVSMTKAVEQYFGEIEDPRKIAEENLLLYATGSKQRPCLSLYDAGEGQLPGDFAKTFCSLVSGSEAGSYKGAIPFVQGRFNMGGTGVLPFCSEKRKLQLIVSRVPDKIFPQEHEWAFTIFCFFPDKQNPSWMYLVGTDGKVLTAGKQPIGLVPKLHAKSGEICAPREREVASGTLVKMYDFQAPRSNVCGELFRRLQEYLLRPALPLRIVECRPEYKANVMAVNVWDRLSAWGADKLEAGFEDGASFSIELHTGETIPGEVRVFKAAKSQDEGTIQTGLRALINGQSHARRDASFFKTKAVDKEHIAGSLLVTLDCTDLGQDSRNALFMSNRENFREDSLLTDLIKKLQKELHDHEGLIELNQKRYEEKLKDAVDDENGINALEELLETDPTLAEIFGTEKKGKVAGKTAVNGIGTQPKKPTPFKGEEFPSYFKRADGTTAVHAEIEQGSTTRVSFQTDVKNNYFLRKKLRGKCTITGNFSPTWHLFDGRMTFTCSVDKAAALGTQLSASVDITDAKGSGPFKLLIYLTVIEQQEAKEKSPYKPKPPQAQPAPSRPDIKEKDLGPNEPPLNIETVPQTGKLQLVLNTTSNLLQQAKQMRAPEEAPAVEFVFKYGLALTAMGLIDSAKKAKEWESDEAAAKQKIQQAATGIARVIVPLCLSLPKSIPKQKG